jgi:Mg2+/Co2+ transporter CorB
MPKTIALKHSESIAISLASFMTIAIKIFAPVNIAIKYLVSFLFKIFLIKERSVSIVSPSEEIRGAIEFYHKEGEVNKDDRDMLGGVLDLAETEVLDIMVHRKNIFSLELSLPFEELLEKILSSNFSKIPLWEKDPENIVGILNIKDLIKKMAKGKKLTKSDLKSCVKPPLMVIETNSLQEQLTTFKSHKSQIAIVVDEYGSIQGIVTLADIIEEIIGKFGTDESDIEKIKKITSHKYILGGEVTLRDFNKISQWDLDDEEASTIAGFVMNKIAKIPSVGEVFNIDGIKFTILKKQNSQITKIKLELDPEEQL